ncbi:MAG: hypothetical protein ABJD13_14350 [Paracoccaceae bacterium]
MAHEMLTQSQNACRSESPLFSVWLSKRRVVSIAILEIQKGLR